jgi:metal-responsive CopG/Arc/MetJ family transcriptional regulator
MRTTVSLEADVAAAVSRLRRERGLGVSEAINALVRQGLAQQARVGQEPFRVRTHRLGLNIDVHNVAEALEQLDGPAAR